MARPARSPGGASSARRFVAALAVVIAAGAVYVGNAWSPSSYGLVLAQLGLPGEGLVWGEPRAVRADEWAVVTPLTQATVRNGFARRNATSLYGEDLRINYGLPLHDWGIVFKPTLWLFGVAPPAIAFSFHWFAVAAMFVTGHALLMRWLGMAAPVAWLLSVGLFFSGATQFWWNEKGPILAWFPWVLLPFASPWPLVVRASLFAYAAVAWLLTNFYPPVQLTLAFVGAALLVMREPALFRGRTLVMLAAFAAAAAATAGFYLWDYLQATSATLYPGQRSVGGGSVAPRHWLSLILPAVNFDASFASTIGENISEIGTFGMYYVLAVLCFVDVRARGGPSLRRLRLPAALLAAMIAWMALPLPSSAGALLLWDKVPPVRMHFAAGLLCVLLLALLASARPWRLSWPRFAAFATIVVGGWWIWKRPLPAACHVELAIVPLMIVALLVGRARPRLAHPAVAAASAVTGALLFGAFNPLQSAWPIFERKETPVTRALDAVAADNGGTLAIGGLDGATANGLGYRAVNHVLATPQLAFWRARFPELPDAEVVRLFNRYAHIVPSAEHAPRLARFDGVYVPLDRFVATGRIVAAAQPLPAARHAGSIDAAVVQDGMLSLWGWAPWTVPLAARDMEIVTQPAGALPPVMAAVLRGDVAAANPSPNAALSGFLVRVPLPPGHDVPHVCLYFSDGDGKRVQLPNPPSLPDCTTR